MDEKRATEIWDHIESHQDDNTDMLAKDLNISRDKALEYAIQWAAKPRGEFIFYLTKK